jgi:predicted nicotinamide N-methyase
MADNSRGSPTTRRIAGFDATCIRLDAAADGLQFWTVADLERYVDRDALLRADDPLEPPYWAMCWTGARVLAAHVPVDAGRVLEIGCGLGVPGAVAAHRGAQVVFVDRVAAPLAFVRETLRTNHLRGALVVGDVLHSPWRATFDVVLGAEILYDQGTFTPMANALAAAVAPNGRILLTDAHRTNTTAFYTAATAAGLAWTRKDIRVEEEGAAITISLIDMQRRP